MKQLLYVDNLSLVMMGLVGFVAISIASFSSRYLKGDRKRATFYWNLVAMVFSVFLLVCADHILLFLGSWAAGNIFLVRLMQHKKQWAAARESSLLALRNFGIGFIFSLLAYLILYKLTGETSIQSILCTRVKSKWFAACGVFLVMAAMTQSAIWPFHRWLISSLNSPTPVSAIMHAGLVNGGGYLLARFSPIISGQPRVLLLIFTIGMITALIGTFWKLMQSDVKRMLACSTMGQMGFMIAQCGLGLFPAAIAHLCWHGLFKAYMFLGTGSAAKVKRLDLDCAPSFKQFLVAVLCGLCGAYTFTLTSQKQMLVGDTTLFLIVLAMIAGAQFALPIIRGSSQIKWPLAFVLTMSMAAFYGVSVHLVEHMLLPLEISTPQALNFLHVIALVLMVVAWLSVVFAQKVLKKGVADWMLKAYVIMLNASQPHPKTVTTHRNHYQF